MSTATKKRILLIYTGGTIAGNVAESNVSETKRSDPDSFLAVLDDSIKIVKRNWNIEIEPKNIDVFNVDSSDILPENWTTLVEKIAEEYDNFDAFIILHGTNTMGYTAAALSFALENINKPVILTGAQVPLGYLGSDATTNLVNSLRLAVWGYHPIKGVIAVFGSKIISGVRVKKGTDFDYDPFAAFITGSLGQIGRFIRISEAALEKHISYLSKVKPLAIQSRVLSVKKDFNTKVIASLTEVPGMSYELFQSLVENNNIKAFVLRAFGAGDASKNLRKGFEYLKEKQIPIVVTTQAPNGIASFQVNEPGKELKNNDLAIPAYDMSIESMTTKMAWLLTQNLSYEQIKIKMLEDLHGEINIENELI
ncbi:asparaginase [Patescibacteria group bacterium]|nr:asparaginase [Patescibacteria group bacterium]MBU1891010.1 asparaginase [Patescibacteria group bacterium]